MSNDTPSSEQRFKTGIELQLPYLWAVVDKNGRGLTIGVGDDDEQSQVWITIDEIQALRAWLDTVMP